MRDNSDRVYLRLDRAFANSDWLNKFCNCKVYHVVDSTSDHCILKITDSTASPPRRNRRFHFEALWTKRDECYDIVKDAWNRGSLENTPEGINSNLSLCASALTLWSRDVMGNIPKKIQEHKKLLNTLTTLDRDGSHSEEINELRKELNGLLDSEEILWHQRSKIHWYREGDRNTKFFHTRASERRRKNSILGLWNDEDCWCDDRDSIARTAVDYFSKIYTSSSPNRIEEVINTIPTRVTDDMNAELTKTFTSEEVLRALHQIHPTKSPGPDGKRRKVINDYYNKQKRLLEGYTEVDTMIETGCASGNPAEDEMKQRERMAILVTNIASIVLFALKLFASIESKSLSIIASILDPFFELLWGFILWLTSHAMQNPNQHEYPIGMKRMQPVGMIVFGSFGLQLLFQAAKQFITKSEPEKDPQKQKWMIGVMTFVTMVQFMLAFYCRRFENKIVRAYAEYHSSNVKTNLISLAAAVLAIRYYWWIDPTGAIIVLLYTMNTWKKTFFENLFALIGRTAPPEILGKLTYLVWNHHEDIKQIGRVTAYASGPDQYFVEVDIVLSQDMVLSETHDIDETLKVKLEQLPEVARAFVHIDSEYTHRAEHRTMV